MNGRLARLEGVGFIAVGIAGTILHFIYEWSGDNRIVALFAPVNESPWEHLKLLFFPFVLYAIFEAIKLSDEKFNVGFAKLIGITAGMLITLSVFYVVRGVLGRTIDAVNIASFFIGIGAAFIISYNIINKSVGRGFVNGISTALLIIIALMFIFFTLYPIKIPLFIDPTSNTYGING